MRQGGGGGGAAQPDSGRPARAAGGGDSVVCSCVLVRCRVSSYITCCNCFFFISASHLHVCVCVCACPSIGAQEGTRNHFSRNVDVVDVCPYRHCLAFAFEVKTTSTQIFISTDHRTRILFSYIENAPLMCVCFMLLANARVSLSPQARKKGQEIVAKAL